MGQAHIVLGLGFGDEGKGLTTDFLVRHSASPIVVRFSGGQQAGHTVIINGVKHIHSNFGSGTLRGKPSYFTEHTSFYLNTLAREHGVLVEKGVKPVLAIHPLAKVTTPYDVIFGRQRELQKRHGSVGLGIGATMKRNEDTGYKLHAIDFSNTEIFLKKLFQIREYYMDTFPDVWTPDVMSELNREENKFLYCTWEWANYFFIRGYDMLKNFTDVVFEGSQGIMLDKDHGIFPNVTYAHTTSRNAVEVCERMGLQYEMYYVTRCYQTRHGNGWMSNEKKIELINNQEEINHPNEWQGTMRVGEIDYKLLNQALDYDEIYSPSAKARNIVVTCLDQRPDFKFDFSKLGTHLFNNAYLSYSPESGNICENQNKHLEDAHDKVA